MGAFFITAATVLAWIIYGHKRRRKGLFFFGYAVYVYVGMLVLMIEDTGLAVACMFIINFAFTAFVVNNILLEE